MVWVGPNGELVQPVEQRPQYESSDRQRRDNADARHHRPPYSVQPAVLSRLWHRAKRVYVTQFLCHYAWFRYSSCAFAE